MSPLYTIPLGVLDTAEWVHRNDISYRLALRRRSAHVHELVSGLRSSSCSPAVLSHFRISEGDSKDVAHLCGNEWGCTNLGSEDHTLLRSATTANQALSCLIIVTRSFNFRRRVKPQTSLSALVPRTGPEARR